MTIESAMLGKVSVNAEASWQVDNTASGTFVDVAVVEAELAPAFELTQHEPKPLQQFRQGYAETVPGWEHARLSLTVNAQGHGVAVGSGDTSTVEDAASGLQLILAKVFGGLETGLSGSTVSGTPGNAYTIPYASGGWQGGHFMGWADANGIVACHQVSSNSGSTATLKTAFSSTPAASDVLYNGNVAYFAENPTTSLQFLFHGAEDDNKWLLMGCQLASPPTLTRSNGELLQWGFEFLCTKVAPEASSTLSGATYTTYNPVYADGELRIKAGGAGTTTRTLYDAGEVSYTFNSPSWGIVPTHNTGKNGAAGMRMNRPDGPAVEVSFTIPYEDNSWRTSRDNKEVFHIMDQHGSTAGNIFGICIPKAQVVHWQPVGQDGFSFQRITLRSQLDSYITNGANAPLARSPYSLVMM